MNLKYKILWIENDADWALSIEDEIKDIVEDNGFVFEKRLIDKRQENFDYKDYDFILMDMKLSSEPSGDKLIKDIRNKGVLTTVLFYSASELSVLRNKVQENELEGVFVASRIDPNLFLDKIRKLIETTIKKVQDLNNIRGLVMAEVSDLDAMMLDIILSGVYTKQSNQQYFYNHLMKDCEDKIKRNLVKPSDGTCNSSCSHKWKGMQIADIVAQPAFDSSLKARAVGHLLGGNFYENYLNEIINVRNNLAHCKSEIRDGKEVLHTLKGGEITYNADDIVKIRQNITKYRKMFEEYLQNLH